MEMLLLQLLNIIDLKSITKIIHNPIGQYTDYNPDFPKDDNF